MWVGHGNGEDHGLPVDLHRAHFPLTPSDAAAASTHLSAGATQNSRRTVFLQLLAFAYISLRPLFSSLLPSWCCRISRCQILCRPSLPLFPPPLRSSRPRSPLTVTPFHLSPQHPRRPLIQILIIDPCIIVSIL